MNIKQLTVALFTVLFVIYTAKAANITQDWHQFSGTRQVTIYQGDTITWVWDSPPLGENHTVTSADSGFEPDGEFNEGPIIDGVVSGTFDDVGTFFFLDTLNPEMRMVVTVYPAAGSNESLSTSLEPSLNETLEPSPEVSPSQALNETLEPSPEISLSSSSLPVQPSASSSSLPVQPSASSSCAVTHSLEPSPSTSSLPVQPSASPSPIASTCPGSGSCGSGCKKTVINIDLTNIFKNMCKPPSTSTLPTPSTSVIPPSESASTSFIPSPSTSFIPSLSASTSFIPSESPSTSFIPSESPSTSFIPSESPSTSFIPSPSSSIIPQ